MGGVTSRQDLLAETEDVSELESMCNQLLGLIEDEATCLRYCKAVFEQASPGSEGSASAWKARRQALYEAASGYVSLVEASEGEGQSPPTSAEALAAAQLAVPKFEGKVNLSLADRDDNEEAGLLYVFELPGLREIPALLLSAAVAPTLTTLLLKKNGLQSLPDSVGLLTSLTTLDVSENELSSLRPELCTLGSLESLNFSENAVEALPEEIGQLTKLTTLVAFKNKLTCLPDTIGLCQALEEVNFFNNKLIKVPASLAELEGLVDLNLGGNKLKTLPSTKKWAKLERLALSWNTLVMLNDFGGMPRLKQLQMGRNQLSELPPDAFDGCTQLESVDVSTNLLTELPTSLLQCATIETLDAASNQLAQPGDFAKLTSLRILKLGPNKIASVADANLDKCAALETLFLNGNLLTNLPAALAALPVVSRVNVSGNKELNLEDPDTKIVVDALSKRCADNKGRWIA